MTLVAPDTCSNPTPIQGGRGWDDSSNYVGNYDSDNGGGSDQQTTGRQSDGSYVAATGAGSEIDDDEGARAKGKAVPMVGDGECVALTEHLTGVPAPTSNWTRGTKVVFADGTINPEVKPGTAIAAGWDKHGHYPKSNDVDKNSATFLGRGIHSGSIRVFDQWNAHGLVQVEHPQSRDVRFYSDPKSRVSDNSNAYYVIIVHTVPR